MDNIFRNLIKVVEHRFLKTDLVGNLKKIMEEIKLRMFLEKSFFCSDIFGMVMKE